MLKSYAYLIGFDDDSEFFLEKLPLTKSLDKKRQTAKNQGILNFSINPDTRL